MEEKKISHAEFQMIYVDILPSKSEAQHPRFKSLRTVTSFQKVWYRKGG